MDIRAKSSGSGAVPPARWCRRLRPGPSAAQNGTVRIGGTVTSSVDRAGTISSRVVVATDHTTARSGSPVVGRCDGRPMPFLSSLAYFGEVAVMPHDPVVLRAFDGIYVPFSSQVFFDQRSALGHLHARRHFGFRGGIPSWLRPPPDRAEPNTPLDDEPLAVEAEEHLYFGPLIPHYGHFLITGLARAWFAARPEFKDRPLLCHSDLPVENHFRNYMVY